MKVTAFDHIQNCLSDICREITDKFDSKTSGIYLRPYGTPMEMCAVSLFGYMRCLGVYGDADDQGDHR